MSISSPGDGTTATIPLVSANMNSVTGARLAATLARRGGLGRAAAGHAAAGARCRDPLGQGAAGAVGHAARASARGDRRRCRTPAAGHRGPRHRGAPTPAARRRASASDDVLGVVPATRLGTALPDARLGDLARGRTASVDADDIESARHAFDVIVAAGAETVCVLHHGHLVGTLSRRSALRTHAVPAGRRCVRATERRRGDRHQRRRRGEGAGARRGRRRRSRRRHRARPPGGHAPRTSRGRRPRSRHPDRRRATSSPPRACTTSSPPARPS